MLPDESQRLSLGTGTVAGHDDTLPEPGATGPRVGNTPVEPARAHPVPPIDRPLHVVSNPDGWMLRFEVDGSVAGIYPRKNDAVQAARQLAEKRGLRVVVHGVDGQIQS